MTRNLVLAGVVVSVLVGCGLPSVKVTTTAQQGEDVTSTGPTAAAPGLPAGELPDPQPAEPPPDWFPLEDFVWDVEDGRSHVAASKPYQGKKYRLRLKVDDFNRSGWATCSFVGGGEEPLASIKLPDSAKKGDVVEVVGTFGRYHPAGFVTPSYITFGYAGSAGGK